MFIGDTAVLRNARRNCPRTTYSVLKAGLARCDAWVFYAVMKLR